MCVSSSHCSGQTVCGRPVFKRHSSFCLPLLSKMTQVISSSTLKRNLILRGVNRYAERDKSKKKKKKKRISQAQPSPQLIIHGWLLRNLPSIKETKILWKILSDCERAHRPFHSACVLLLERRGRTEWTKKKKKKKCADICVFWLLGFVFAQTHCFSLLSRGHSSDL